MTDLDEGERGEKTLSDYKRDVTYWRNEARDGYSKIQKLENEVRMYKEAAKLWEDSCRRAYQKLKP